MWKGTVTQYIYIQGVPKVVTPTFALIAQPVMV